ncbi:Arm DNA-binding domain-containing protein [Kaistia hirudinis]|uniref:Arm DNA-binding domain-containing protein n=1 Tax=Kaistia hirudinis TaxID=1293440 RepID=UPI0031B5BF18
MFCWIRSGAAERHTDRHDSYPITDLAIRSAKRREKAYKVSDSGGLHLLINPGGSKLWRLAYKVSAGLVPTVAVVRLPAAS